MIENLYDRRTGKSRIDVGKVNELHKKYSDRAMDLLLTTEYERTKEEKIVLDLLNEIVIDLVDCGCEN